MFRFRLLRWYCGLNQVNSGGEDIEVKKAPVGGQMSEGMVCDAPMLGWKGGAAGAAAVVPDSFALGSKPPAEKPRGK